MHPHQPRKDRRHRDAQRFSATDGAVSDIVGEILMTAIFIVVFSAAGVTLLTRAPPEDLVHADIQAENRSTLRLVHVGGERLDVDGSDIILDLDGTEERHALSTYAYAFQDDSPDHWDPAERLCVSCEFPGQVILSVEVVTERQTVMSWLGRYEPVNATGGVFDPGFAYEDVGNDALYVEGTDASIANADVHDGTYTVSNASRGLVIPPSVGDIQRSGGPVEFIAGGNVRIDVDLTSGDRRVLLRSSGGNVSAFGVTVSSARELLVQAPSGHVDVHSSTIASTEEHVRVDAGTGIDADGSTFTLTTGKHIELVTAAGDLRAKGATLQASNEHVVLQVNGTGNVLANASTLQAEKRLELTTGDGDLWIRNGTVTSEDEFIRFDVGASTNTAHVEGLDISEPNDDGAVSLCPSGANVDGTPDTGSVDNTCS